MRELLNKLIQLLEAMDERNDPEITIITHEIIVLLIDDKFLRNDFKGLLIYADSTLEPGDE